METIPNLNYKITALEQTLNEMCIRDRVYPARLAAGSPDTGGTGRTAEEGGTVSYTHLEKKIAFNTAYELSFLKPDEQQMLVETMDYEQATLLQIFLWYGLLLRCY